MSRRTWVMGTVLSVALGSIGAITTAQATSPAPGVGKAPDGRSAEQREGKVVADGNVRAPGKPEQPPDVDQSRQRDLERAKPYPMPEVPEDAPVGRLIVPEDAQPSQSTGSADPKGGNVRMPDEHGQVRADGWTLEEMQEAKPYPMPEVSGDAPVDRLVLPKTSRAGRPDG